MEIEIMEKLQALVLLSLCYLNVRKHEAKSLAYRSNTAIEESVKKSLECTTSEFEDVKRWGETPDVVESNAGKLATPAASIYPDTEIR